MNAKTGPFQGYLFNAATVVPSPQFDFVEMQREKVCESSSSLSKTCTKEEKLKAYFISRRDAFRAGRCSRSHRQLWNFPKSTPTHCRKQAEILTKRMCQTLYVSYNFLSNTFYQPLNSLLIYITANQSICEASDEIQPNEGEFENTEDDNDVNIGKLLLSSIIIV